MKKILLSAVLTFLLCTTTQAQEMAFGFKAGYNLSEIKVNDDRYDYGTRGGLHIGGLAELTLSDRFSLQAELFYSQQGASKTVYEWPDIYDDEIIMNYINLPVLAKFYIVEGLAIEAGPQIGYLLKAEQTSMRRDGFDSNVKDSYKLTDFSIVGGISYEFPLGLFLQARYANGLNNINKEADLTMKNNVFSFCAGFKF